MHLRLVDAGGSSDEARELALESLLEFTGEPALLADLYANYDCDVACTNLFEVLVRCLGRRAVPDAGPAAAGTAAAGGGSSGAADSAAPTAAGRPNVLHRLALEGLLAAIDRCAGLVVGFGAGLLPARGELPRKLLPRLSTRRPPLMRPARRPAPRPISRRCAVAQHRQPLHGRLRQRASLQPRRRSWRR